VVNVKKQAALIGFGTIGQYLFERLSSQSDVKVTCVYDANKEAIKTVPENVAAGSPAELEKRLAGGMIDLVVETATQQAVVDLVPGILKYSDIVVFSTTAFADEHFEARALALCHKYARKIYIPHGAILGLDGIRDSRDKLESVAITTTKKPVNLGSTVTKRTVLFEGPTRSACKLYPRNVNVHASVAIAGLGFDKTQSRIIADPDSEGNVHSIEIAAEGIKAKIEVCSMPLGLVTGVYTPLSAYNSVSKIFAENGYAII
jgi:aspartate dehydrogenase